MARKKIQSSADRTYRKCPSGYMFVDPARSKRQAIALRRANTGNYSRPVIVKSGKSRGKNKAVFPYHVAVKRREYNRGGR